MGKLSNKKRTQQIDAKESIEAKPKRRHKKKILYLCPQLLKKSSIQFITTLYKSRTK